MPNYTSTIKFYKDFPINGYQHEVYYSSESARDTAFDSYTGLTIEESANNNLTAREIVVDKTYQQMIQYNYGVIIRTNRRYYFFVDDIIWDANLKICTVKYSYDYWQNYCYSITWQQSFITQGHIKRSDDTFGAYLIPEDFPITNYYIRDSATFCRPTNESNSRPHYPTIVLADTSIFSGSTQNNTQPPVYIQPTQYQYSLALVLCPNIDYMTMAIEELVAQNKGDSIVGVYLQPNNADIQAGIDNLGGTFNGSHLLVNTQIQMSDTGAWGGSYYCFDSGNTSNDPTMTTKDISNCFESFTGGTGSAYTPKNKKCFIYPYNFTMWSNNQGSTIIGKYEETSIANPSNPTIRASYYFPIGEGATPFLYLTNYNGISKNWEYSLAGVPNRELPYTTNQYSAYISANTNSIQTSYDIINANYKLANDTANVNYNNTMRSAELSYNQSVQSATAEHNAWFQGNFTLGGAIKGATSFITNPVDWNYQNNTLYNQSLDFAQQNLDVAQANAQANKDLALLSSRLNADNSKAQIDAQLADIKSKGDLGQGAFTGIANQLGAQDGFKGFHVQVSSDNIKMIDNMFELYGYKLNIIDKPSTYINTRSNWNYIQVATCNFKCNAPQGAIDIIKSMFTNGVTLWHSLDKMYNYNEDND